MLARSRVAAMAELPNAIGGYFGLELPPGSQAVHPGTLAFQSARAAFLALLRARRPRRVWLPRYVCDALVAPLQAAGIPFEFYSLTDDFEVADDLRPGVHDWIVCVRYFGIFDAPYRSAAAKFGADRIVADHAQAWFSPPSEGVATLYSPRKFFGIPDGGLLASNGVTDVPPPPPFAGPARAAHLFKRLTDGAEAGYADYLASEEALVALEPSAMSEVARRILSGIDMERIAAVRRQNFEFLHARLGAANQLACQAGAADGVPLCYPLLTTDSSLREALRKERIYTATYWSDVLPRCEPASLEARLACNLVAVPCDQRYGAAELQRVVDAIDRLLG